MQVFHHTCDVNFYVECGLFQDLSCGGNFEQDSNFGRDLISGVKLGEQEEPRRSPGGVLHIVNYNTNLSKYSVNIT